MEKLEPYDAICWVTHWKKMVEWPEPLSRKDISKHKRSLLPEYSSAKPYYRVIFDNVLVVDAVQKKILLHLILSCVKSEREVYEKGHSKPAQYYIDVRLKDAVQLRRLMMMLRHEKIVHTIQPYEGKEYGYREGGSLDHLKFPHSLFLKPPKPPEIFDTEA